MVRIIFLAALALAGITQASAKLPVPNEYRDLSVKALNQFMFGYGVNATYRIGDEWGKIPVTDLSVYPEHLQKVIHATARVGGGTGYYIGQHNGQHIVATNFHVCETSFDCEGVSARFTTLGKAFEVTKWLGSWNAVDFALLVIKVDFAEDAALLNDVKINMNWDAVLTRGQKLATAGYGVADNSRRVIVMNTDNDCVVFSGEGEYRLMADPDDLNPGPYKAWSFANGCDVSHGDSGSAMVDRETGEGLGIIWTGRIPKNPIVQNSAFLNGLLRAPTEAVWKELSYGVPSSKMKEHLLEWMNGDTVDAATKATISAILM